MAAEKCSASKEWYSKAKALPLLGGVFGAL